MAAEKLRVYGEKFLALSFFTVVLSPFVIRFPYVFNSFYTVPTILLSVAAVCGCVFGAIRAMTGPVKPSIYASILLAFLAWLIVSGTSNPLLNRTVYFDRIMPLAAIFIVSCVFQGAQTGIFREKIAVFISLLAAAAAVTGLVQFTGFLAGFSLPFTEGNKFEGRLYSLLGNPDIYAAFCAAAAPFFAYVVYKRRKAAYVIFFLAFSASLLLTRSMSGIAVFCAEMMVLAIIFFRGMKAKIFITVAACVVLAAGIFFSAAKKESFYERRLLLEAGLIASAERPVLGAGAGNFIVLSPHFMEKAIERTAYPDFIQVHDEAFAHNDYIQTMSETGIPGLLLFVLALFYPFFSALKKGKPADREIFMLVSMGGVAVFAAFNFPFYIPLTAAIYFMTGAMLSVDETFELPGVFKPLLLTVSLCAAAAIVIWSGAYYARNYLVQYFNFAIAKNFDVRPERFRPYIDSDYQLCFLTGISMDRQGRYADAIGYFDRALKLYPYFSGAMYNMGNAYLNSGDTLKAKECYNGVISLIKNYPPAYNNLGVIYIQEKDYDNAVLILKQGIKYSPDFIGFYLNLGKALYFKGKYQDALIEAMQALKLDRNSREAMGLIKTITGAIAR
jgi:tetratricopeptide (TPR) repeat protein